MKTLLLLTALVVAPTTAREPVALGFQDPAPEELPSDARIREAWSFLLPDEQAEVTEWFRAEVGYLQTYQNQLINYLIEGEQVDRGTWPEAEAPDYFEPELHAPGQPIARKWLDPESKAAQKEYERLVGKVRRDPMRRAWAYDWNTGGILRTGDERDAELLFENALLGLPPLCDLAEALLLRRLDDGSQRETLRAFDHAYTDRSGKVFPGITLYDAWCSEREFEMPDVDVLGIVHTLWDEWDKWVAPIPASQHKKLYAKVGDVLVEAKHHRQLLEALAANYIRGKAIPLDLYNPNGLAFNALWDEHKAVPEDLREELPDADDWEKFLKDLVRRVAKKKAFREAGQARIDWLEAERYRVKSTLVWVMTEFGAFERERLPEPEPAPRSDS